MVPQHSCVSYCRSSSPTASAAAAVVSWVLTTFPFLLPLSRGAKLEAAGFRFMGMGVSGGEEGARNGPSLMPGSTHEAYEMMEPILTKIAAQVDDGPCVTYVGELGAGNYVKMVHNGIEYGDMQLISEAYELLKVVGRMTNDELAKVLSLLLLLLQCCLCLMPSPHHPLFIQVFAEWNTGELESFLIEITAKIFAKKDEDGSTYVLDNILDKAGNKGMFASHDTQNKTHPHPPRALLNSHTPLGVIVRFVCKQARASGQRRRRASVASRHQPSLRPWRHAT